MSLEASRRSILQMLSTRLIPFAMRQGQSPPLLMEPLRLHRERKDIFVHHGPPLPEETRLRSPLYLHRWNRQRVHSVRFPCLAAVVEGEIDWRIGITQSAVTQSAVTQSAVTQSAVTQSAAAEISRLETESETRQADAELKNSDYLVVPIREGTFYLMPSGVPYSDGSGIHWERTSPRSTPAVIFWLLALPSGVMCHYCRSTAEEHHSHRQLFIPGSQIHQIVKMLEEELRQPQPAGGSLAALHLQLILGYVQRGLQLHLPVRSLGAESISHRAFRESHGASHDALQRAQMFIEMHLQENLSPSLIAEHAYLSARQLDRYFQRELGANIMDYVILRRVEVAKGLLQVTDLPVRQVAELVGYNNPSSFTQIFKRRVGISPQQYRQDKNTS